MSWQGALGAVGSIVGSYFGGPIGGAIGGAFGSLIGAGIDGPEQLFYQQEGYRIDDLTSVQTTSAYGLPIPIVYGRSRVGGQLIFSSGLKETIHTDTTTVSTGKGGGGVESTTEVTTYTYSVDCAIALCEGPIIGVRKIWADGQLIYNISTDADATTLTESLKLNDIMTVYSGTETQLPNTLLQSYEPNSPAYRGLVYIVFADLQLGDYGNRIPQLSFEVIKDGHWSGDNIVVENISLSSVLLDMITTRSKITEGDVDVSLLTSELVGYKIDSKSDISKYIEQLLVVYTMDVVESEGKLKFVPRGGSVVAEIPEDSLCAYDDSGGNKEEQDYLTIHRVKESDLPKQISISYYDPDKKYEVSEQHIIRQNVQTKREVSMEYPMILTNTQAIQLIEILLYSAWIARTTFEFKLSFDYLYLEPGDIVEVTYNNTVYNIRIAYMELGYPGLINIRGYADDANTYTSTTIGTGGTVDESISGISDTVINFMDMPLVNDNDDDYGFYIGVCGETSSWNGCIIYKSLDGGITYTEDRYIKTPTTMGVSETILGSCNQYCWDEHNTVDVQLYYGQLESKSDASVLNFENMGLLGDEIIQWKNATLIGTNKYRLSGLLRGCKGTDYAIDSHTIGERFVYLVRGTYTRNKSSLSEVGVPLYYKVVSYGNYISDASVYMFTNASRGKRPLSPVHITATRDISGNITIEWIRRTRVGGTWRDYTDVPLGETSESYAVEINSDGWTTYYRTISSTTTSCVYTSSQQIEDFGSTQSSVEITLYQISAEVGGGFTAITTV
jgi:hypothetical protein